MDCCKQNSTGVSSNFFQATLRALNHESKKKQHRSSKSSKRSLNSSTSKHGCLQGLSMQPVFQGCHFARTTKERTVPIFLRNFACCNAPFGNLVKYRSPAMRQCSVCTGTVVFPLEMEINPWCCNEFDQIIGTFKQADYCSCRLEGTQPDLSTTTTEGKLTSPLLCSGCDFPQSHQPCCHHPPSLLGSNGRQCNASCSRSHQRNQPSDDIHQLALCLGVVPRVCLVVQAGRKTSPLWCFAHDLPQSHQLCCHHPPSLLGSNGRQCNASCSRSHQRNQPSDDIHQLALCLGVVPRVCLVVQAGRKTSPLWCFAHDLPQSHQLCCHHPPSLLGSNGRQCNASCSRSHQRNQPSDDIHQLALCLGVVPRVCLVVQAGRKTSPLCCSGQAC